MNRLPRRLPAAFAAALAASAVAPCGASLSDEIQVYTDDINVPGEAGLELHVNTTPRGRSTPDYPGEVVPEHGLRLTPEFSYGLAPSWEAGLYLPISRDASGNTRLAGAKLRLKWLPIRPDTHGGWFAGVNTELSRLQQRFSESRNSLELRGMVGWRSERWLFAVNPLIGWSLSPGYRGQSPDFSLASKVARTVRPGLALGLEYYNDIGTLARVLPAGEQGNTLYAALDWSGGGWDVNVGIGHGLTRSADPLTVKAIVGFPF